MALAMAYCAMFKTDFPIVYCSPQHFAMNKTGFASSILMCIAHQGTSQGEALQKRAVLHWHSHCVHAQAICGNFVCCCFWLQAFNTWPLPIFVDTEADQSCSCSEFSIHKTGFSIATKPISLPARCTKWCLGNPFEHFLASGNKNKRQTHNFCCIGMHKIAPVDVACK